MDGQRTAKTKKGINVFMLVVLLASLYPIAVYAATYASIIISREPLPVRTSGFGRRTSPCTGCSSNHKGQDYRARTPTNVTTNAPVTACGWVNGYGYKAQVKRVCTNGNVVLEEYAHLTRCPSIGATTVLTGSTGVGTAPHLHYNVLLGGTYVDPISVLGKELCDNAVRSQLITDARNKGIKGGGGGATGPANPTTPPSGGGPTIPPYIPPPSGMPYDPAPTQPNILPAVIPPTIEDFIPGTTTDNEVTGCSTETWRAMVNQSVLQTRREMLMNERYIAKADSVLAYSCFEAFEWHAADHLGILSESQRWTNRTIDIRGKTVTVNVDMGALSLDGAIADAVDSAVEFYLTYNFDHEFLGGLLTGAVPPVVEEDEDDDGDDHGHGLTQYNASCGVMREVWQMAKCHNVTDDPMFYRFEELIDNDPRIYPHNYACKDSGITANMIDRAQNKEAKFDPVATYFTLLKPAGDACAAPIPTGVKITIRSGSGRITEEKTYDDALCITAGCSYQNPGASGLGTCEIMGN